MAQNTISGELNHVQKYRDLQNFELLKNARMWFYFHVIGTFDVLRIPPYEKYFPLVLLRNFVYVDVLILAICIWTIL